MAELPFPDHTLCRTCGRSDAGLDSSGSKNDAPENSITRIFQKFSKQFLSYFQQLSWIQLAETPRLSSLLEHARALLTSQPPPISRLVSGLLNL
jgi:hypothetical protein